MKKKLGFWEIWNMSFGFLGIQFGFALQGGFMSRIFQTLGADESSIPLLWIAAPLTGLIVQPIIGYLSDNTWHSRLGRRKPYFLIGAILSSIALFFVPYSPTLWMAAGFLWILDASINISMEPFRALVADKLPESQRSYGFVTQTLIIGIGTWIASNLPYFVSSLGVSDVSEPGTVPDSVKLAFAIGAGVFFISILSVFFLGEKIGYRRILAVIVGFIGVVIILNPGAALFSNYSFLPLIASFFLSIAVIFLKKILLTNNNILSVWVFTALCTCISLFFYNDTWIWPQNYDLLFMVASGFLGFIAQICLTKSFQLADASLLAPLDFSSVIWSFFIGYILSLIHI